MKNFNWAYECCVYLLALMFLYTVADKLMDFHLFVHEIDNQPFSKLFNRILVIVLPAVELLAVMLLLLPGSRVSGLKLSLLLMTAFTIYVALVTFHFFKQVPCACAGVFHRLGWTQHLLFNIAFTALAMVALIIHSKNKRFPATQKPG